MKRFSIAMLLVATLASAVLAQNDTAAWIAWTRANHFPIASVVSTPQDDFADLRFFKNVIGERRLVQLGESGHGVGQFDSAKVRLIKFFHEQMGFDVIAFESSIYECFAANTNATNPVDMLQRSIFTVWATEEVLPLFDYIQATQRSDHPLLLAGFDTQISSPRGVADRPAFLRRVIAAIDSGYADEVASFDTTFVNALRGTRSDPAKWDESEAFYDRLDQFFREHHDELVEAFPGDPTPLIAERAAYSMVRYIRQLRAQAARPTDVGPEGAGAIRDAGMAENVTVLARDVYPDRKILIWAHNFHIRYANASTTSIQPTMGAVVAERFRPDLYTIGLYMNSGSAAYNDRTIYLINPAISGSMEWVLANTGPAALFVDFLQQGQEQGNGWMFQPVYTREWGTSPLTLVPREQYDGVLLIDRVTPPNYLRF
jgi:erythromycin esterase